VNKGKNHEFDSFLIFNTFLIDNLLKHYGYVIAKCCEMFFVEMNEQSASNA
jgi:hypothetical protein